MNVRMPGIVTEADRKKAAELAEELVKIRERMKDPATPKRERPRLRLQIDTYTWVMERLDPQRFGKRGSS